MSSPLYNYPKTSCFCEDCAHSKVDQNNTGTPSSLAAANCNLQPWDCHQIVPTTNGQQPDFQTGDIWINPSAWGNITAVDDFHKVKCPHNTPNCKTVYASPDPRLLNPLYAQNLTLDRPPLDSSIALKDVYTNPTLEEYGKTSYDTYSDIKAGQILYYVDKAIAGPFFSPVFTIPSDVRGGVFKDPMGGMKPQYDRTPLTHQNPINTKSNNYNGLSWIDESNEQREDLIARQMAKRNQQSWMSRLAWGNSQANTKQ